MVGELRLLHVRGARRYLVGISGLLVSLVRNQMRSVSYGSHQDSPNWKHGECSGAAMKGDGRLSVNFVANFEGLDIRANGFDNSRKVATERDE